MATRKARGHRIKQRRGKFKSLLEKAVDQALKEIGLECEYEPKGGKLPYIVPTERHTYTPDFVPKDNNNIIIEAKGRLTVADRKKMLLLKEQYPEKTFYLLFSNANQKLYKGSKTTYGQWAEKHGFEWCDFYKNGIPEEWF